MALVFAEIVVKLEDITTEFKASLIERITKIRKKVVIDSTAQQRGIRFFHDQFALDGVIGAVMVCLNPKIKDAVAIRYAFGLDFKISSVEFGKYDMLIIFILTQLATVDYDMENSNELH